MRWAHLALLAAGFAIGVWVRNRLDTATITHLRQRVATADRTVQQIGRAYLSLWRLLGDTEQQDGDPTVGAFVPPPNLMEARDKPLEN